jgi:PEP-CTERM motif
VQPASGFLWPTVDNFVLAGAAAVVPEPQVYAMLLAGLGFVGFMARRRRG